MSMKTLEEAIIKELRQVSGVEKLKIDDVMEWSTTKLEAQEGEKYFYLPHNGVHCAVKLPK